MDIINESTVEIIFEPDWKRGRKRESDGKYKNVISVRDAGSQVQELQSTYAAGDHWNCNLNAEKGGVAGT